MLNLGFNCFIKLFSKIKESISLGVLIKLKESVKLIKVLILLV